jgi:hypothetical protein
MKNVELIGQIQRTVMMDPQDRRRLAEAMRHLADGLLTNDEFEERGLFRSEDDAVREIQWAAWGSMRSNLFMI